MIKVSEIRTEFNNARLKEQFTVDRNTGVRTIELLNAVFIADEPTIFGTVNEDYVRRELAWYRSMSLNVNDIEGGPPTIWEQVSDKDGFINSNYGWCIYSEENGYQFKYVVEELIRDPNSRRANMIYTRPSMHTDYNKNGMSDFMCTNNVQYVIREGQLHAMVYMRSNDAVYGYKNDYAWQKYVQQELLTAINNRGSTSYGLGRIMWNVGSLHVYDRHWHLIKKETA